MVDRVNNSGVSDLKVTEYGRTIYADGTFDEATTVVNTNYNVYQERVERSWDRTPNYRYLVSIGAKLPDNDFVFRRYQNDKSQNIRLERTDNYPGAVGHQISQIYKRRDASLANYVGPDFAAILTSPGAVNAKVMQRARRHQFNLPVFLAELRKTSSMVVSRATQLAMMAYHLKRGDLPSFFRMFHPSVISNGAVSSRQVRRFNAAFGKNSSRAAANAWLEYRYGWIPFISEVQAFVNTTMDLQDHPTNMVSRVSATIRQQNSYTEPAVFETGGVLVGNCNVVNNESRRIVWRFSPNASDIPAKLVLTNPASVAWELLPLSFVADWFLPIGDYLAGLDDGLRFTHQGGTRGFRQETIRDYSGFTSTYWHKVSVSGKTSATRVIRERLTSIPSVQLSDMRFNPNLGAVRVASAIALLRQRVKF